MVPLEVHAAVHRAFPVHRAFVKFFNAGDEVLGVVYVGIFDAKIVNHQREVYWFGAVLEWARG